MRSGNALPLSASSRKPHEISFRTAKAAFGSEPKRLTTRTPDHCDATSEARDEIRQGSLYGRARGAHLDLRDREM